MNKFSKIIEIQASGISKTVVGGDSINDGIQLGYDVPPRPGLVFLRGMSAQYESIRNARFKLMGYESFELDLVGPQAVIVELPCQIWVEGTPGTEIAVTAWEAIPPGERGAALTLSSPGDIPIWARTVDAVDSFSVFDTTGALILAHPGPVVGFSLPPHAASFTTTQPLTFRQG